MANGAFVFINFNHLRNIAQKPHLHPGMQGIEKPYQWFSCVGAGTRIISGCHSQSQRILDTKWDRENESTAIVLQNG